MAFKGTSGIKTPGIGIGITVQTRREMTSGSGRSKQ